MDKSLLGKSIDNSHHQDHDTQYSNNAIRINKLQQEVSELQDDIKDLEQMLKMNRDALKISLMPFRQYQEQHQQQQQCINNDTITTTATTYDKDLTKNLVSQIDHLYDDNTKLYMHINRLTKDRNIEQSKALISEQICEEAQRHEIEALKEVDDKIHELKKLLQDKEFTIHEFEKIKPTLEFDGILLKYKEITDPNEQAYKLEAELEKLNSILNKVNKETNKIRTEVQDWQNVNFNLMNEISKLRATFSSPLNAPPRMISGPKLKAESVDFNNSCIGFMNDSQSSDSEIAPQMETKVVNLNTKESIYGFKAPVPKLDLTKAKKIQEINAKKSTQQAIQGNYANVDQKALEKLKMLETELNTQKVLLSKEMITNKSITDELDIAIQTHKSLIANNHALIKSNKKYEKKWQKIYYTLEFYKEFYHKYIDLVAVKSPTKPSFLDDRIKTLENFKGKIDIDMIHANPDQLIKGLKKIEEKNGRLMSMSMLEAGDIDHDNNKFFPMLSTVINENKKKENENDYPNTNNNDNDILINNLSKEQCKIYLMNVAKDLHINTKLNKAHNLSDKIKKRSSSTRGLYQGLHSDLYIGENDVDDNDDLHAVPNNNEYSGYKGPKRKQIDDDLLNNNGNQKLVESFGKENKHEEY